MDEAYVTVGNLSKYPVYTTIGRQYVPFGVYDRHPIEPTLTQYLTQTQATAAKLGFVMPLGLYGAVYTFRGQSSNYFNNVRYNVNNLEAKWVSAMPTIGRICPLDYQLSVGYLEDLGDTDWIANVAGLGVSGGGTGSSDVPAISVDGKISQGPFALHGSYVQALKQFQSNDPLRLHR